MVYQKRRWWCKLHVGTNVNTQKKISVCLTGNNEDDVVVAQKMIPGKIGQIKKNRGDGAYDNFRLWEKLGTSI